ncbi:MAG: hypothetical protein WAR78_04890, partial [Ferruginibacter sp.]
MSKHIFTAVLLIACILIIFSCTSAEKKEASVVYTPDSRSLYDSIVHMDSVLFGAYNTCDMVTMASCFSEDIEFYHDQG